VAGPRARWGRAAVLAVVFVAIASTLSACAGRVEALRGVSLLQSSGSSNRTWPWTAACPRGPASHHGCAASGTNLGHAQLNGDNWNLGGGAATKGSVDLSVSSAGAVTMQGNLPSAPPCVEATCIAPSANTWVRGYPNVLYGLNQCSGPTSPKVSADLKLPMKVSSIPKDLVGTTSYTSWTPQVTHDIAYDMWLNDSDTKTPCQTDGTVEVMVWTDYDARALLPASEQVANVTVPFKVNGVVHSGAQDWSVYVNDVFPGGQTQPWGGTLWFVLHTSDTVSQGTVSVDLSRVLTETGSLLQHSYGWSNFAQRYWLDTVPFGIEYGPQSASLTGAGSSYFTLRLSRYCLNVGVTLAQTACEAP
jgi:hypothetical protein